MSIANLGGEEAAVPATIAYELVCDLERTADELAGIVALEGAAEELSRGGESSPSIEVELPGPVYELSLHPNLPLGN